jgi:hypothetical protein
MRASYHQPGRFRLNSYFRRSGWQASDLEPSFFGLMPCIETTQVKFVFLGMWVLGSTFILWANAGLKRVRIDGRQLFVSNFVREIRIPFSAIVDVRQNRWLNSRPITIYFRDVTEFGDRATFMPKWRIRILFWRIDPVVDELKQLAALAPNI